MNVSAFQQLVICVIHYPPFSSISCSKTGEPFAKSGIVFDFFSHLSSSHNFSHVFRCVPLTGSQRSPNGSWTGTIGNIYRDECHMILMPFGVFYERFKYLTFSSPITTVPVLMVSGEPTSTVRSAAEQFFRTNPLVLVTIILGISILSVIIGIIEKVTYSVSTSSYSDYMYGMISDLLALFNNPNDILLLFKSYRSKLILVLWRLSFLVIKIQLGASVNAQLTTLKTYLIDDYRDLLARPNIQPLIYKNSMYQNYFSKAETAVESALWRQLERTKGLINMDKLKDYRHDISRGKSVFIGDTVDLADAFPLFCRDTKPEPRLHISRRPSTWFSSAFLVSRSFPKKLLHDMNGLIRRYVEYSHYDYFMKRGFSHYSFCLWKPSEYNAIEKNKNVNFLLYLWSSAIWISTLAFITELLLFRFKGKLKTISLSILAIFSVIAVFFWLQMAPA